MNAQTIIRTQAEIADASTSTLVATYNSLTGKNISKFSSRAAAEAQVANAILSGQDRAAHAGVPKGNSEPIQAITADEAQAATNDKEQQTMSTADMKKAARDADRAKRFPSEAAKKVPAKKVPAKKVPAKKAAAAAPAGRKSTYNFVRVTEPDTPRRPQADSKRTQVLNQMKLMGKGNKRVSLDELSDALGFNCRPYIHKLTVVGWCEVIGEKA